MYNDFVIVGPKDDAKANGKDLLEGLRRVAAARDPSDCNLSMVQTHRQSDLVRLAVNLVLPRQGGFGQISRPKDGRGGAPPSQKFTPFHTTQRARK